VTVVLVSVVGGIEVGWAALARENVVLFVAIGVVELIFFLKIALKFVPAPPSYMNQQVIDTLKEHLSA